MCVIDTDDEALLILSGVYTPGSTDDAHIAFRYSIAGDLERAETILYLTYGVKCVGLGALHRWLTRDIALREILICGAKYTLPRTSPELREERNDRHTRKGSDSALAEHLPDTRIIYE
jgi:hypothetical protein